MSEQLKTTVFGKEITVLKTKKGFETPFSEPKGWKPQSYQYKFPEQARVIIQESMENWGGYKGKTKFISTEPAGAIVWNRGGGLENYSDSSLLGANHHIFPDGTFCPPELFDSLKFAEETLGYEVDAEVWKSLALAIWSTHPQNTVE